MSGRERATAFAPASTANLAVGFDILGHALSELGDRITARRVAAPGVRVAAPGGDSIPSDPARNTAAVGVAAMLDEFQPGFGVELEIEKGIPLGSGVGGSAASAVAGVVAANALFPEPLPAEALLPFALLGEAVASGGIHADNVAPALLGGLVLVRSAEESDVVRLPVPPSLRCVIALPELRIDTRDARAVLPPAHPLAVVIQQGANLGAFVAALHSSDIALIGRAMRDVLIEPHRAALIPGFAQVQGAALREGALGCSISGAGPAMFAWCDGEERAAAVQSAMMAAFEHVGLAAKSWISRIDAPGARIEDEQ